jgi:DNA topoisomerase-1
VPLADCPKPGCGGKIIARRRKGGRGKEFYGCTNYPQCDFVSYYKPANANCPQCGHFLVEKQDKQHGSYKACINPECGYLHAPESALAPAAAGHGPDAEDQSA